MPVVFPAHHYDAVIILFLTGLRARGLEMRRTRNPTILILFKTAARFAMSSVSITLSQNDFLELKCLEILPDLLNQILLNTKPYCESLMALAPLNELC